MEENKIPKWLQSSADPARLAASVKGFLTLVVGVASVMGIDIPGTLVDDAVEMSVAVAGAGVMLFGLIRKVVLFVQNQNTPEE